MSAVHIEEYTLEVGLVSDGEDAMVTIRAYDRETGDVVKDTGIEFTRSRSWTPVSSQGGEE